jgi:hypothetical protein
MIKLAEDLQENVEDGMLYVPDGKLSIKKSELAGNIEIESAVLPSSLSIIDDNSFAYTDNLKEVTCYGNIQYVGTEAFEESGLEKIDFKQGCASINDSAFAECRKLSKIVCKDFCNLSLGEKAFYHCESLKNISLSNSLQEIQYGTFFKCKNLTNIDLPQSLQTIRSYAFAGCESLVSMELPDTVQTIEDHAFDSCKNLTYVYIPEGVTILENKVFNRCTKLQDIVIPKDLKLLDMSCFLECGALKEITIGPETVLTNESMTPYIKVNRLEF